MRDHFDWTLFITVAALAVIGVINLYSATSVYKGAESDDYIQQIYWLVGGGILATVVAGTLVFAGCGALLHIEEIKEVQNGLMRRLRRAT